MNDFTKEELESLCNCLDLYDEGSRRAERPYQSLLDKIQSMIEAYHEPLNCVHEPQFIPIHLNDDIYKCIKCGEFYS